MARFQKGQSGNPATQFKPGNPGGPGGRNRKLANLPPDARDRVYAALWHVLSLRNVEAASRYLDKEFSDIPELGVLCQVYAKGLLGKKGVDVAEQMLDRLFGKPKQTTDFALGSAAGMTLQINVGTQEAAEGLRRALQTGAQPAAPTDTSEE